MTERANILRVSVASSQILTAAENARTQILAEWDAYVYVGSNEQPPSKRLLATGGGGAPDGDGAAGGLRRCDASSIDGAPRRQRLQ